MFTSIKRAFFSHLFSNLKIYIGIAAGYLAACILGAVLANFLDSTVFESLSGYVRDLFAFVKGDNLSLWAVFSGSFRSNALFLLFLWGFGFTVIGLPLIVGFVLYKGMAFGFTGTLIIRLFGWQGLILVFLLLLAQLLFAVPAYFFSGCNAIKMSTYLFRFFGGKGLKHNSFSSSFFVYTVSFLLPLFLLTLEALYGAYVLPPAFQLYLSLFGGA